MQDMLARALRLDATDEVQVAMQELYSAPMLGCCCGVGGDLNLKPFVCALYTINVVSRLRIKQSSRIDRLFSSKKRVAFDAHKHLLNVTDKVLEKHWDSGVYGVFVQTVASTSNLEDAGGCLPQQPPLGW
jgi:hypothetical protein